MSEDVAQLDPAVPAGLRGDSRSPLAADQAVRLMPGRSASWVVSRCCGATLITVPTFMASPTCTSNFADLQRQRHLLPVGPDYAGRFGVVLEEHGEPHHLRHIDWWEDGSLRALLRVGVHADHPNAPKRKDRKVAALSLSMRSRSLGRLPDKPRARCRARSRARSARLTAETSPIAGRSAMRQR